MNTRNRIAKASSVHVVSWHDRLFLGESQNIRAIGIIRISSSIKTTSPGVTLSFCFVAALNGLGRLISWGPAEVPLHDICSRNRY